MSIHFLLYITLPLIFIGCATKPSNSPVSHRYDIDKTNQASIPDFSRYELAKFRQVGTTTSTNSFESSSTEFTQVQQIQTIGDKKLKVSWKIERLTGSLRKAGKSFTFKNDKILRSADFSLKVDCSNRKVFEKSGFEPALSHIEKETAPGEEQDFLIKTMTGLIETAPNLCLGALGPFERKKFIGKKPGERWQENVPIEGLEQSHLEAEFLGWHNKADNKAKESYAVIYGHLDDKGRLSEKGQSGEVQLAMKTYLLISSDGKRTLVEGESRHSITPDGEKPIFGQIKSTISFERLQ